MEYIFKDIAKFDTQNPIVNDIIKQTQKLDLDTLPSIKDIEIRKRLDKLRNGRYYKNENWPPPWGFPPSAPGPRPPRLPLPPNKDDFFNLPSPPHHSYNFSSPYIPSAPDPPLLPYYSKSNIKDDDDDDDDDDKDDDFDINFPEKNLTPTQKFLLSSKNTQKSSKCIN